MLVFVDTTHRETPQHIGRLQQASKLSKLSKRGGDVKNKQYKISVMTILNG